MMSRRTTLGAAVIVAWIVGLVLLVRREYFRPQLERLAEAATHVAPGAVYYGLMQGDRQVGFASSSLDTTEQTIMLNDYLVADLPVGGKARRATARTNVTLTRALHMSSFDLTLAAAGAPVRASGDISGDSLLVLAIQTGAQKPDTQRVALSGPILLPTLVPLAVALGEHPKVGQHYILPVFDPATMAPKDVGVDVRAESSFVVNDSSVFDSVTSRWRGVRPDTIRAWQVVTPSGGGIQRLGRRARAHRRDDAAGLHPRANALRSGIRELARRHGLRRRIRRSRHSRDDGDRGEQAIDRSRRRRSACG